MALIIVKTLRRSGGLLCASRVAELLRITVSGSFGSALRANVPILSQEIIIHECVDIFYVYNETRKRESHLLVNVG